MFLCLILTFGNVVQKSEASADVLYEISEIFALLEGDYLVVGNVVVFPRIARFVHLSIIIAFSKLNFYIAKFNIVQIFH